MTATVGRLAVTPDPRRRRRARRASRGRRSPTRSTTPTCCAPTPSTRVQAGDRRARLLAQPRRPQPAHPRLAPDRPARSSPPRRAPPTPRWTASCTRWSRPRARRATTCCCSPARRTEDPLAGYDDLLRSTAVDAFVVTDTYLGNPQAAWLSEQRAPFVAFGRPWDDPTARHPWVDVDGAAGAAPGHLRTCIERGHQPDRLDRLAQGLADRRGPPGRLVARDARARPPHHGPGLAGRGHRRRRPARPRRAARRGPARPAFVCASDTLAMGVLHTLADRGLRAGTDIAVVGFDDSEVAQVTGLTSVRQPLEEVAVEVVGPLRAALDGSPTPASGTVLTPRLVVRGSSLRGERQRQQRRRRRRIVPNT